MLSISIELQLCDPVYSHLYTDPYLVNVSAPELPLLNGAPTMALHEKKRIIQYNIDMEDLRSIAMALLGDFATFYIVKNSLSHPSC